MRITDEAVNLMLTVDGKGHHYVIVFNDEHVMQALHQVGRWASDTRFGFSWHDAAQATEKIRELYRGESGA